MCQATLKSGQEIAGLKDMGAVIVRYVILVDDDCAGLPKRSEIEMDLMKNIQKIQDMAKA